MADEFQLYFGNSDSDASFEGFDGDFDEIVNQIDLPQFDIEQSDGDLDLGCDIRLNWSREVNEPLIPPFVGDSGIKVDIDENASPIEYLNLFLTDNEYTLIADETNRYFEQIRAQRNPKPYSRIHSWYDTCANEIRKFLGLTIMMGLVEKRCLSAYWSTDYLDETPVFSDSMQRDRFMNLLSFLHVNNNDTAFQRGTPEYDPIHKVRPIYDVVTAKFRNNYVPRENVCIDEGMVPWRGRLTFRQYIPDKPDKFGIKLYTVCESASSYVCDFDIYTGADYDPNPDGAQYEDRLGHSYNVVLGLLRRANLLNKGYTVYLDNYYSSPTLFDNLSAEDTSAVGTVRLNRKEMPKALGIKIPKSECLFRQRDNLLALKWTDKRDVTMLSTKHQATMSVLPKLDRAGNPILKPTCVLDYNSHMGGVDVADQLGKYYTFTRKTVKWWMKLFFHIINLAITNSYILYVKNQTRPNRMTHYKFRKELARALINSHINQKRPRGRPSNHNINENRLVERHFPDVIPTKPGAKVQNPTRQCVVCNVRRGKRPAVGESRKRKETRYWCPDCKKPLCVTPCFRRYHTLVHYKIGADSSQSDSSSSDEN